MKKSILTIIIGLILFVSSLAAAMAVNKKINNTKYELSIRNSAGGRIELVIDGELTEIESGKNASVTVKRKNKVNLNAKPDEKHDFAGWEINSSTQSDSEITLTITKNLTIKSKYESKTVQVTVDGVRKSYGIANSLLKFLQSTFPADPGYNKTFYIGENVVTDETEISADTQITSKQELISYTVTFKHNNEIVATKTYTVENKSIILPTLEQIEGYTIAWPDFSSSLDELKNFIVYSVKTPIEYTATFKNKDRVIDTISFNITNKDNVVAPAVPAVDKGYEAKWEDFTLGLANQTINLIVTPIEYTITFKHADGTFETVSYTTENKTTVQAPSIKKVNGYIISWPNFSSNLDELKDFTVEAVKTPIEYTVTFKHNDEIVATETYTVENKNITYPKNPASSDRYEYSWKTVDLIGKLESFVIESTKTARTFNITYKGLTDDEINALNNKETYTCKTETFTLTNPTREGYNFIGWTENDGTEKTLSITISKDSFGNRTYTAHWEKKVATIILGELTNVSAIYYGTSKNTTGTLLTQSGFKADSTVNYFFKAVVRGNSENQYYVLESLNINDADGYGYDYNSETGFKFADDNNTYLISAIANPVDFTVINFAEPQGISNTETSFDLWLNDATREGENFKYSYHDEYFEIVEAEISIDEYLRKIYSNKQSTKTITSVRFTYTDSTFDNKPVLNVEALIRLFKEHTTQKVTVTFTYSA